MAKRTTDDLYPPPAQALTSPAKEVSEPKRVKLETPQPVSSSDRKDESASSLSLVQQRDLLVALQTSKKDFQEVAQQLVNCQNNKNTIEGNLMQCINTANQMKPYQDFLFAVMPWIPPIGSITNRIRLVLGKEVKGADLQSDADAVLAELALDRAESRKKSTDYAAFANTRMQKLLREQFFLDDDRKDTPEYKRKKAFWAVFGILSGSPAVLTNIVGVVENLERSIRSLAVRSGELAREVASKMRSNGSDNELLISNLNDASNVLGDRSMWLEHPASVEHVIDAIEKLFASVNEVLAKQLAAQTASSKQINEHLKQLKAVEEKLKTTEESDSSCKQELQLLRNQLNDCGNKLRKAVAESVRVKAEPLPVKKEEKDSMPPLEADGQKILLALAAFPWFPVDDDKELDRIATATGISTVAMGFKEELLERARFIRERQDSRAFQKLKDENEQLRGEIKDLKQRFNKDKLPATKKEEQEPTSMALVLRSSSSDVKDPTALVRHDQPIPMDGDCWEELEKSKELNLAFEKKLEQLKQEKDAEEKRLKDDMSRLNERLHALRTENERLGQESENIDEDVRARLKAAEDCDKDRTKLREQLNACIAQRDRLQAALDQCYAAVQKGDDDNKTFLGVRDELKAEKKARVKLQADLDDCYAKFKKLEERLARCEKELEECNEAREFAEQKRDNYNRLWGDASAKTQEGKKMVGFMDSVIQNLTTRATEKDMRERELETNKSIAEAQAAMAQVGLNDLASRFERLAKELQKCHNDRIRAEDLLRRADRDRVESEQKAESTEDRKMISKAQNKEQILKDANKKLNKTACNFIEDSLEFMITGSTSISLGLSGRTERREAAMYYIHALCAEPHWAFLVARYLGKDYSMAYPLSAQIQLVLMDENDAYYAQVSGGPINRGDTGWFTASRRRKVIRVLDAFIMDIHYHSGMRQWRRLYGKSADIAKPRESSFRMPDVDWVMKRVGFWTDDGDAKQSYSNEDRMEIVTEMIRAYQLFDLFDLDTSVPPVEIGWQAFLTDEDKQSDVAGLVTRMVHKRDGGDNGHELIWGTIRDNPKLLRYWRYEYPEPLVLLLPLWNYIMHTLDNSPTRHAVGLLQANGNLGDFFEFLPNLKQQFSRT